MDAMIKRTAMLVVLLCTMLFALYAQNKEFRQVKSELNGVSFTPSGAEEYVGDPMPFYDESNKLFRIFYLRDRRTGSNKGDNGVNYHPIAQVTTADAVAYKEVKDGEPILAYGINDPSFGTGCVIKDDNKGEYLFFYTGHRYDDVSGENKEVVLRAYSTDGISWHKNEDWIIKPDDAGYITTDFRDPSVIKVADNDYRMLVSAITSDYRKVLAEYKSSDLWTWTSCGVFKQGLDNHFYECADVFEMEGYWYLVYSDMDSAQRCVKYYVADSYENLKTATLPYRIKGQLDGKSFYAGKTASNGTSRYIWGWCGTKSGQEFNEADLDWGGSLVCHQIIQNKETDNGINKPSLCVKCPDTFKNKMTKEVYCKDNLVLEPGSELSVPERLGSTNIITFSVHNAEDAVFGMRFIDCPDHDKYSVRIEGGRYHILKFVKDGLETNPINELPMLDTDVSDWFDNTGYDVTVVTDNSICVVYVNGVYAFTNRIYGMEGNPWTLFYESGNGSITISDLKVYTAKTNDVIWNGEGWELDSNGGLWDMNSPKVVENTDKTGINKSDKCLKYTATGKQQIQIPLRDWLPDFNLNGNRRLSLMVKKQSASNVVMELSDPTNGVSGYWAKTFAWYDGGDTWQKIVFDFTDNASELNDYPGVVSIYASLEDAYAGEDIYIDNVVVEPLAAVDGIPVGLYENKSFAGRITLGGSWMKGECMNLYGFDADDKYDDRYKRYYNDYAVAYDKMTRGVYEVDMRKANIYGGYNVFSKVNPNCIVYTLEDNKLTVDEKGNKAYNVVVGNVDNGNADCFMIDEGYPFRCTEDFTAWEGLVKRRMAKGYWNTMVLPFYIQEDGNGNLGGAYARLTGERRDGNGNVMLEFTSFDTFFDANVPFLVNATDGGDGYDEFSFQNIKVCKTPELLNSRPQGTNIDFIGTFSYVGDNYDKAISLPVGSYFLYNNTFKHVVTEDANTMKPMRGYFMVYDEPSLSKLNIMIDGISTKVTGVNAGFTQDDDCWYTLQGIKIAKPQQAGVYINKNRVVLVK